MRHAGSHGGGSARAPRGSAAWGAGLATLATLAAAACADAPGLLPPGGAGGGAPLSCDTGCPAEQKCHYASGECIWGGLASCESCGLGALCTPLAPEPTCVLGACEPPAFGEGVAKVVRLRVTPEGEGCDLDGDGAPNNSLSAVLQYFDLDAELDRAVAADRATVLLEPSEPGWGEGGGAFDVSLWFGTLAPQSLQCSPASPDAVCTYTVSRLSYDPVSPGASCSTWLRVRDVKQTGGDLASPAPGPGTDMVVPTDAGGWLLQLLGTQLSAAVSSASASGPGLGPRLDGRLCAAVPKGDLLLVADTLPDDVAATYGGRDLVRTFIDGLIAADLDVDGDGKADAASVSLDWTAVPARIVGYSPLE